MPGNSDTWISSLRRTIWSLVISSRNGTFDDIAIGDSASLSRKLSQDEIALFAIMSGDVLVDGPLAIDNAVSEAAAQAKHIVSPVAGNANILLVPDLEAGNMLAKRLTYMADADATGIVLGARIPIMWTSRADTPRTRIASAAVAVLLAHARRKTIAAGE